MKLTTTNILQLKNTLVNGQCFNWWPVRDMYVGVIGNMLCWLKEKDGIVIYDILSNGPYTFLNKEYQFSNKLLLDYFHMEVDMEALIARWKQDQVFSSLCQDVQGLRIVRQDPFECLISFIISSNNNISRITKNLLSLRENYGTKLGRFEGKDYHLFPTLEQLSVVTKEEFDKLGLGYRSKYLLLTCTQLKKKGGEKYLYDLQEKGEDEILDGLLQFLGVGRKVADCVRLYSLKCYSIVPLDTHILKLYEKEYSKSKSVEKNKNTIQKNFRDILGNYAGWAQSFLFTAAIQSKSKKDVKDMIKQKTK